MNVSELQILVGVDFFMRCVTGDNSVKIYKLMYLLKVYVKEILHYSNFIICFVLVSICRTENVYRC